MGSYQEFQFHVVRLKEATDKLYVAVFEFQFHVVRLKVSCAAT